MTHCPCLAVHSVSILPAAQSDACRSLQLRCHTAKEGHLFRKFGCVCCGRGPLNAVRCGRTLAACRAQVAAMQAKQSGLCPCRPFCPCLVSRCRWGNRKSLVEDPAAAGLDVRAELLRYYK